MASLYPLLIAEDILGGGGARGGGGGVERGEGGKGGGSMLCAVLYLLHRRDVLVSRQVRVVRANGCV